MPPQNTHTRFNGHKRLEEVHTNTRTECVGGVGGWVVAE